MKGCQTFPDWLCLTSLQGFCWQLSSLYDVTDCITIVLHNNCNSMNNLSLNFTLLWRHNGRDGVLNHPSHHVYSTVYSGADQRKHQSSTSLAFVRWPVNSTHKGPVTRKMFPFDDVIMNRYTLSWTVIDPCYDGGYHIVNRVTGRRAIGISHIFLHLNKL